MHLYSFAINFFSIQFPLCGIVGVFFPSRYKLKEFDRHFECMMDDNKVVFGLCEALKGREKKKLKKMIFVAKQRK